ncbi:hypothetical protein JGS22_015025 [Streptomyces sp. P38-E01]|uniref:Uncharacterized protein n=1 Tax=Streptomyces tardus TaxID=2780544 RepID=A0A949JF55_9ACTN|nr:hypothetical protein [Streptomyces tardus]MBU7598892.1 hypothetical protein [Streptomyces tardus]
MLHLNDRMSGAGTYAEAAEAAEEVLHSEHGLLERLRCFFEAAAEQATADEDVEGWHLADRFTEAASSLGDLAADLTDAAEELRALGPPTSRPSRAHTASRQHLHQRRHEPPCPGPPQQDPTPSLANQESRVHAPHTHHP